MSIFLRLLAIKSSQSEKLCGRQAERNSLFPGRTMKSVLKIKTWPLLITGILVWLLGTAVPIASDTAERVARVVGAKCDAILAALSAGSATAMTMLGPLRPASGSLAEAGVEVALMLVPVSVVGLLIGKLALRPTRRHARTAKPWICSHCRSGDHRLCRGALLFASRANSSAATCRCAECALNRD